MNSKLYEWGCPENPIGTSLRKGTTQMGSVIMAEPDLFDLK